MDAASTIIALPSLRDKRAAMVLRGRIETRQPTKPVHQREQQQRDVIWQRRALNDRNVKALMCTW